MEASIWFRVFVFGLLNLCLEFHFLTRLFCRDLPLQSQTRQFLSSYVMLMLISRSFQMYMRAQNSAGWQELPSDDAQGRLPAWLGNGHCKAFGIAMDKRATKVRSIAKDTTMSIVEVPETERTRHLETLPQEQGLNAPHGERSHSLEPGNHSASTR
jgi:hypothetical protein